MEIKDITVSVERMDEVRAFNDYLTSMGVTAAYDVGYLDGSYDPVTELYEQGELDVRVFYAQRYWADTNRTSIAAAELLDRVEPFRRDDRYGVMGIGEHVHGILHDSTANDNGFPEDIWNDFTMIARSAAKNGWQLNEHVMQDSTANRMMSISEEISKDYPTWDLRWTLGHADLIKPETVERAKRLGWHITIANHTMIVRISAARTKKNVMIAAGMIQKMRIVEIVVLPHRTEIPRHRRSVGREAGDETGGGGEGDGGEGDRGQRRGGERRLDHQPQA